VCDCFGQLGNSLRNIVFKVKHRIGVISASLLVSFSVAYHTIYKGVSVCVYVLCGVCPIILCVLSL